MKRMKIFIFVMMALCFASVAKAQEQYGFEPIDVQQEFEDNAFSFFTGAPILMAGDSLSCNAMTIGWGAMGNLWGMHRPTITVYVAQGRYTHKFMESSRYFTVMTFSDAEVAQYMGRHSGRDGDKGKALGLHVAYTENGAPYYQEATSIFECEVMYGGKMEEKSFRNEVPRKMYENFPAGIHSLYIGEVKGAWIKKGK